MDRPVRNIANRIHKVTTTIHSVKYTLQFQRGADFKVAGQIGLGAGIDSKWIPVKPPPPH